MSLKNIQLFFIKLHNYSVHQSNFPLKTVTCGEWKKRKEKESKPQSNFPLLVTLGFFPILLINRPLFNFVRECDPASLIYLELVN